MRKKLIALLLPLALSAVALGHGSVTSTGCLQSATDPKTYVLNSDSLVHTGRNSSALTPAELARVQMSYIKPVPEGNVDFQSYVGHRARVKGFLMVEKPSTAESTGGASDAGQLELRVTSIRRVAGT